MTKERGLSDVASDLLGDATAATEQPSGDSTSDESPAPQPDPIQGPQTHDPRE